MTTDRSPHAFPRFDTRRGRAPAPQAAPGRGVPPLRSLRVRRGCGRPHHRPRPRAARPLLGQPARHELQADPRAGPPAGERPRARWSRGSGPSTWPPSPSTRRSTRPGPTSWPPPTPTPSTARPGRRCAGLLDPLTQDACVFYGDHALFDDYTGVVLDLEEGKRIAHALGDSKAVILANHGLLTVGQPSTRRRGGSSPWSAPARRSSWPRRPARRCSIDKDQAEKTATRWAARRGLVSVPAALRLDRGHPARPARRVAARRSPGSSPAAGAAGTVSTSRGGRGAR